MKPHRLHPYPRAPTTPSGSAPRDRARGDTNPTHLNQPEREVQMLLNLSNSRI